MAKTRVLCATGFIAIVGAIAGVPSAQAPASRACEVASVKATNPDAAGPFNPQRVSIQPGERVVLNNVSLQTIIQATYRIGSSELVGGPGWLSRERFDIEAKADDPTSADQLRLMLRTLLADRFKLVVHNETRNTSIYALVLAQNGKLGPNLHQSTTDCPTLRAQAAQSGDRDPCGVLTVGNALITGRMSVRGMTVDTLAGLLGRDAGRPVIDKTGLAGSFDWELTWTPQAFLRGAFDRERFATIDPNGPSIFTAVREQLGLKLDSEKSSVDVLVIDHVEHPTED